MKKRRATSNNKKVLLIGSLIPFLIAISLLIPYLDEKNPAHLNPVDEKITHYTNKNTSPNAIATDIQFKNITFGPTGTNKSNPEGQIAAVFSAIKSFSIDFLKLDKDSKQPKEKGTWIWTPVLKMTPEYMNSIVSGAKENGINTIYVSIDSYLDIFTMNEGKERESLEKKFSKILADFITLADSKGIAVDAEAGWQNWSEEGNEYKGVAIVDYVKKFNRNHNVKFRGFQYDVEPYLLDSYKEDKATVLKNFVEFIDQTANFIGDDSLHFSVVIPDFYDKRDKFTPKFSYNNREDYAFGHLLNILSQRSNSTLIIMSYRNFAEGKDGAIEVSKNEMRTAKRKKEVKIIIAQETGDVPPPYITYHNTSKQYFYEQIEKINAKFDSHSNFGGIAIHYVNTFLTLK